MGSDWETQYDAFIEVLNKEKHQYGDGAECVDLEIQWLRENKQVVLKDDPMGYVVYLHVNHELNKLDPLGMAYPSIWHEYSQYAWKIIDMYQSPEVNVWQRIVGIIDDIWESVHIGSDIEGTWNTASAIEKVLNHFYRSQHNRFDL